MVFRADASKKIGTGHVMRSTALAEEAIYQGIPCIFIGDLGKIDWLEDRVQNLGFVEILHNEIPFSPNPKSDILIIDSYVLDPNNEFLESDNWKYVISIADEVTPEYKCDLIVHPGLDDAWLSHNETNSLSGPDYILIRKSIKKSELGRNPQTDDLRLLVAAGGADTFGLSLEIAKILDSMDIALQVHFFTNEKIKSYSGKNFINHEFGPDFDSVAEQIDVVISTASTTCLEFICREIPMGIVSVVDNQENYYNELTSKNYALPLGYYSTETGWILDTNHIFELLNSENIRKNLRDNLKGIIDFDGAKRVISFVKSEISDA